jgi:tetratricopeptide (TPR) repeat protein
MIVVASGAITFWCQRRAPPPGSAVASQNVDFDEPAAPDPGYLGPQACAACHAQRVAEFQATRHFQACRLPQAETMPPGFAPERGSYVTRDPALHFEMTRAGGDFVQTAIRATPAGEQRMSTPIALVYGSAGTADEIYFTWHGDKLYELPMAWLHPLNRWGEQPFNPYDRGDFTRTTTPRCLECHNTWFEHVAGTENQYQRHNFILGVTCEKCHGPGREHVAFHQSHPEARSGHAVVHPGRLTRDRQMDLCAQCHSNALWHRGPAFSYRPGEPLESYYKTATIQYQENDHVADQVKYLRQSKCFQKSDTLTCITCHNPHRPEGPANTSSVQRSCLKCHRPADCAEQDRLPAAVRGDCVGCHMPRFTRIQVFFHTEDEQYFPPVRPRQHRIGVYPTARQEVLLGWYREQSDDHSRQEAARLRRALVDHWLAEAENYRRAYRFMAAIAAVREALRFDPTPAVRDHLREVVAIQAKLDADWFLALHQMDEHRYPEAIETLNKLLDVKPDHAKAHGKLGTLYAMAGQNELAVKHLQAVAQYDPDDSYGYSMLGWLAYLQDKAEDAVEAYRRADEMNPFNAKTNYHMGLALAKLGRSPEAIACFRRVVTIDPNHAGGWQCLSHELRQQGQLAKALPFALRAARLTRFQNPDILVTLAETYADAERFADAENTATQALDAAQASDPRMVPQIRRRLDAIRARAKQAPN